AARRRFEDIAFVGHAGNVAEILQSRAGGNVGEVDRRAIHKAPGGDRARTGVFDRLEGSGCARSALRLPVLCDFGCGRNGSEKGKERKKKIFHISYFIFHISYEICPGFSGSFRSSSGHCPAENTTGRAAISRPERPSGRRRCWA